MATPYGSNATHSPFSSATAATQPFPVTHMSSSATFQSTTQSSSPAKESGGHNPVLLCRRGQETIQEILTKTTEVFQYVRTLQMPNGVNVSLQQFQDRKHKLEEPIRQLEVLFRRLRLIYDSLNESTAQLPIQPVENLLVYLDAEFAHQENPKTVEHRFSSDEDRELVEQLQLKNRQLKEIVDQLRTIIWEINTMMTVRRTLS